MLPQTRSPTQPADAEPTLGAALTHVARTAVPSRLYKLLQGRLLMAIFQFCLAAVLWFFLLGWLVHLWSILDAAWYKPKLA